MATLSDSLVSSSSRRLAIRRRPDLTAQKQQYLGQSYIVVKEPVGLNYFRFQEEEYAILQMLDGKTSLDEIKERFEAEFPPQKITLEELQQFLGMLHRSGLVIADLPGQGRQLRTRREKRKRQELLGAFTNVLAIRFKGFDPEQLLKWLYPKVAWFFSPVVFVLSLILMLSAGTLILVEFDTFRSKLPEFHSFFSLSNAWLLAVTLALTKVLHEFGHGLSCKHFGGECHEMGVMILVLTPCLYCNVSDSWMLPSKWKRAAIGAAGMYVEVVLASVCTFIWWNSQPQTILAMICLNIMFISSVSTIIFNANPLLRYDGYYILSDVAEIPNLRQKATTILSHKLGWLCLGLEQPDDPFLPKRNQIFFALYSVAAAVYRWFVLASILWFMYQVFEPYGLKIIGKMIIGVSLVSLVGMPLYKLVKFFYVPGRIEKVKTWRLCTTLAVLAVVVVGILFIPVPHNIKCPFEIRPRDEQAVPITVPGTLIQVNVRPGDRVVKGQQLALLENVDLQLDIERLIGQRDQYLIRLDNLRRQGIDDAAVTLEIPALEEGLAMVERQLTQKRIDQQRLVLRAPIDGVVLPPEKSGGSQGPPGTLPTWRGSPMDEENLGAYLDRSTRAFCMIGDPKRYNAMLLIEQTSMKFIDTAMRSGEEVSGEKRMPEVSIKFDQMPHDTFTGRVVKVSIDPETVAPQRLSTQAGGDAPTVIDPKTNTQKLQTVSYNAHVPLDDPNGLLRIGLKGRAKVHVAWEPLCKRMWRFVMHTFNFKM